MTTTQLLSRIIGPVLLLRAASLLVDRAHVERMLDGIEREVDTVSFSLVPVALCMAALAVLSLHHDHATPAGLLITLTAWGMLLKASALILAPRLVVAKARRLGRAGFLHVVTATTLAVGGYLSWVGYLA